MAKSSGKTREMLNHLKYDDNTILIVASEQEAYRLRYLFSSENDVSLTELRNRILSARNAKEHMRGRVWDHSRIIIDELDSVLYEMFGVYPKVATITER